jgi:glycosyltransferase involved in cell wall biosynthesis
MQKTNFPFEVLINDDASTDGTADVIREYEEKYPHLIKPIYQTQNQYSQGVNFLKFNLDRIQGKYVAMCEGDDYWIDENKLQIQVDYLDAHPECSVSFHLSKVVFEDGSQPTTIFPTPEERFNQTILSFDDLLRHNFIQTNTVMYRWRFLGKKMEEYLPSNILPGDWYLHLLHAQTGNIAMIDRAMGVYRRHPGGVWWASTKGETVFWKELGESHLRFLEAVFRNLCPHSMDYLEYMIINQIFYYFCVINKNKSFAEKWRFIKEHKPYWNRLPFQRKLRQGSKAILRPLWHGLKSLKCKGRSGI